VCLSVPAFGVVANSVKLRVTIMIMLIRFMDVLLSELMTNGAIEAATSESNSSLFTRHDFSLRESFASIY